MIVSKKTYLKPIANFEYIEGGEGIMTSLNGKVPGQELEGEGGNDGNRDEAKECYTDFEYTIPILDEY